MNKEIKIRCGSVRIDRDQYKTLIVCVEDVDLDEAIKGFLNDKDIIKHIQKQYCPMDFFEDEQIQNDAELIKKTSSQ